MKHFVRKFALVLVILAMVFSSSAISLKAEDGDGEDTTVLLSDYEHTIWVTRAGVKTFPFNKASYDTEYSTIPKKKTVGALPDGEPYVAYYPNSVTYFNGKILSVKVEVEYLGQNDFYDYSQTIVNGTTNVRGIALENNEIQLGAFGVNYKATVTFYEGDLENTDHDHLFAESRKAKIDGAVAFEDPDQSNYITEADFGLSSRKIYCYNVTDSSGANYKLADFYKVEANGLFNIDDKSRLVNGAWPNFQDGLFAILLDDEDTFVFTIQGKQDNLSLLPSLLKVNVPYKIEWYYQVNGQYPDTPDYGPETREADIYEKEAKISATGDDLSPVKQNYVLDTSHSGEWTNVTFKEDGTTVLKVYFKQELKVTYHDNVDDEDIFEDQVKSPLDYGTDTPKFTGTPDREAYDFLGWTTYPGELKKPEDLLSDDDINKIPVTEEADYYAQWSPKTYTIKYEGNGADNDGIMKEHDYGYYDTMNSKENAFEREGYVFLGFKLKDDPNYPNSTLYSGEVNDFTTILKADPDRVITLEAQWEPLYTIKYNANGGQGKMDKNEYPESKEAMPSAEEWTFTRKGYKLIGFKLENDGELYPLDSEDFKQILLGEADREIVLYAQWVKIAPAYVAPVTGIDRH
ncbi:MAG: InlB B-repeat-containing protein [Erysipelotrichaceae bacterium]|nr:InlB B-repeat-containing protein [Erysipelotrichaceae bacterium]